MFIHVSGILLCCCIVSFQIHVDSISFLSGASLYYVCSGRMLQVLKGSFWRYRIRTWTGSWKTYIKYVCIYIYYITIISIIITIIIIIIIRIIIMINYVYVQISIAI